MPISKKFKLTKKQLSGYREDNIAALSADTHTKFFIVHKYKKTAMLKKDKDMKDSEGADSNENNL